MAILRSISFIVISLLFSSCWETDRCKDKSYSDIYIYDWEGKPLPKKGKIIVYKEGSNFKKVIQEDNKLITEYEGTETNTDEISIYFPKIKRFYPTNDYQLILNDTLMYKISEIETMVFIDSSHHSMGGPMKSCTIKSMRVNNQIIEAPRVLMFSNTVRQIINK